MALAPHLAAMVAHLWEANVEEVLSGAVPGVPSGAQLVRDDVTSTETRLESGALLRIYRPVGADGSLPALVWAHGGGWRLGSIDMPEADSVAQVVAASLPAIVVTVGYRRAPQHPHPAGRDDVAGAHRWTVVHAEELGVDAARVAVGGASAGGHLAALAGQLLRDQGAGPAAQWLAYPACDPIGGPWEPPHPDCPPVIALTAGAVQAMFASYVGVDLAGLRDRADDPGVVPARAPHAGLPPTLVTTAEVDGLEPQGRRYVDDLRSATVAVTHHHVESVMHGYLNLVNGEPLADAALARHIDWLRDTLA